MRRGKENIFVRCQLCGAVKIYKRRNEWRCPNRYTHKWMPIKWDDEIDTDINNIQNVRQVANKNII